MSTAPAPNSIARSTALRAQIEASLAIRFAGALTPISRHFRELLSTGIDSLDSLLNGGLPIGAITEFAGPLSSGRTGAAFQTMASAMRQGSMCAWVDASDAFDPESAAANGVRLEQLLWVRCGVTPARSEAIPANGQQQRLSSAPPAAPARAGQHPREEVRGLDRAVGELLRTPASSPPGSGRRDRSIGTPGAANRPLAPRPLAPPLVSDRSSSPYGACSLPHAPRCCPLESQARREAPGSNSEPGPCLCHSTQPSTSSRPARQFSPVPRQEQVSSDRLPSRRPAPAELKQVQSDTAHTPGGAMTGTGPRVHAHLRSVPGKAQHWSRLDQALRATDLLLQAGGFRVLVLDLGSIAPEHAARIPLATWFRFRAAADQSRSILLILTQSSSALVSYTRSSAALVLQFSPLELGQPSLPVLESVRYQAQPLRQRFAANGEPIPIHTASPSSKKPSRATWQLSPYPIAATSRQTVSG